MWVKHPKQNHLQQIQKRWGTVILTTLSSHPVSNTYAPPPRFDINTKTDGWDCVSPCKYGNILIYSSSPSCGLIWSYKLQFLRAWAIHVGLLEKTFDLFRGVAKIIQISWQLNNGNEPGTPVGLVEIIEIWLRLRTTTNTVERCWNDWNSVEGKTFFLSIYRYMIYPLKELLFHQSLLHIPPQVFLTLNFLRQPWTTSSPVRTQTAESTKTWGH